MPYRYQTILLKKILELHLVIADKLHLKEWGIHRQQQLSSTTGINLRKRLHFLPIELAVCWRYWDLSLRISEFNRKEFSGKAHSSAANLHKKVTGFEPGDRRFESSEHAIFSMTYDAPENCTVQFKYEFYVDNQRALLLLHISQLIVTAPPKFNSNLY